MPVASHEERLIFTLRHPMRRMILRSLGRESTMSPSELADRLDVEVSNLSYHVRVCAEKGAIELVDTRAGRGSPEHFYRMTVDEPWALGLLGLDRGGNGGTDGLTGDGRS